ncbi:hypothetical protein ACEXQE_10280 [Herbiconiux sp. P17]|uniref:hypothetical protein n=1 Tax=Herbiconiux wuyangfengii TaxID=3342794 RepID=UPI0035BB9082
MDGNYKMSQTGMHEFAIHDKPGGALRATIARDDDGTWATHSHDDPASGTAPRFENQAKPQAAFDAFVAWANGDGDDPETRVNEQ